MAGYPITRLPDSPIPLRLLHCADIHIGYETHGRLDPQTGLNTRLLDFRRCFDVVVQRALDEKVDVFLFCGDAYRTADPTPTQQKLFAEALAPVARAGIPIIMIVGNHDHPVSFGKASSVDIFPYLEGNVHVYRRPAAEVIATPSGPLQVIALPWPVRNVVLSKDDVRKKSPVEVRELIEARYAEYVHNAASRLDPAAPAIVAAHIAVHDAEPAGSERASLVAHEPRLTVEQLAQPGVDYVALGHIHRFQDRNRTAFERGEGPPVVYSSSLERISFKEHDARKGFVLVDIEAGGDGKQTRYEFVETPARRFVPVEVDARGSVDPTSTILAGISEHEVADTVVRVRYRVSESEAPLVDNSAIREALRPAYHIAEVVRLVEDRPQRRPSVVRRETSLEEAIRVYAARHAGLEAMADDLVATALELEAQVDEAD